MLFLLDIFNVLEGIKKPFSGILENQSDLPTGFPYGSNKGRNTSQILGFGILSPFFLLLELLNAFDGRRTLYTGSLESWSDEPPCPHPYGSKWGHKIVDFVFCFYLLLLLELSNVLECNRKPYAGSLESQNYKIVCHNYNL